MNIDFALKYIARALFIIATVAIVVAFLDAGGELIGLNIVPSDTYKPGRVLELAATLLVFVIAVLLRQIRDELRTGQGS